MKKVKIIYIVSSLKKNSPTIILGEQAQYAAKNGYDVEILTLSKAGEEDERPFLEKGFAVTCLKVRKGLAGAFGAFIGLRKYLEKQNSPCLLHAHGIRPDFLLAVIPKDPRRLTISTLHNIPIQDYTFRYGRCAGWLLAKIHLWAVGKLDRFVSVSSCAFEQNASGRVNGALIHNGVDASSFKPLPESDRPEMKRKLGWHDNALCCVVSSVLNKGKNLDFLLKAFLETEGVNFHLIILGTGPEESALKEMCKGDGRIEFRGFQTDVVPYLQTADCYFSASKAEGLPCSVLESLLCGTAVFLSDIPPHAEILKSLPSAGKLFGLSDAAALKKLIETAIPASPNERTGLSAAAAVLYSSEVMVKKYLTLYSNIIKERNFGD